MSEPNAEILLHLAALAAGLSIAYVGLDKIHPADRKLDLEIDFSSKNWALLVQELELNGGLVDSEGNLNELYNINSMHLLCFIARNSDKNIRVKSRKTWRPYVLWLLRQYHFPLLSYFRNKIDLGIIMTFAFISTVTLLLLSSRGLFPREFFTTKNELRWLFWYYVLNIFFIFGTAICSAKLFSIKRTCSIFEEKVRTHVKRFTMNSVESVSKILAEAAKRV